MNLNFTLCRHTGQLCGIFAFALILFGCKPTENNYRQAYETAQRARQAERSTQADLGMPELTAINAPQRAVVNGDTVFVRREALTLHGDAPSGGVQPYNVAVGKYKMTANALSDAEALRKAGYNSFVLASSNGEFYTVVSSAPSIEEAVKFLNEFVRKNPKRPYLGLPGKPVIEIPLGSH